QIQMRDDEGHYTYVMSPEVVAEWNEAQLRMCTDAPPTPPHPALHHDFGAPQDTPPYVTQGGFLTTINHHTLPIEYYPHNSPDSYCAQGGLLMALRPEQQYGMYTGAPRTPPYPVQCGLLTTNHHHTSCPSTASMNGLDPYWSAPGSVSSSSSSGFSPLQHDPIGLSPEQPGLHLQQLPMKKPLAESRKRSRHEAPPSLAWDGRLTVNPLLVTHHSNNRKTLWRFVLDLLIDEKQKEVVVWTGKRREFKIVNMEAFRKQWGDHNDRPEVKWSTIERIFRGLFDTVIISVPTVHHKGRNVPGLYQFITEPSYYLSWSEEELDVFISQHAHPGHASETAPTEVWAPKKRRRMARVDRVDVAPPPHCMTPPPPSSTPPLSSFMQTTPFPQWTQPTSFPVVPSAFPSFPQYSRQ
ncbi:hypothetical protein PENTCL1PPCAC_11949, partial [Pristionchus entomophagus]